MKKNLYIIGTRGLPARHGGFETFAEKLGLYLVNKNWNIFVYCQKIKKSKKIDKWKKINLININVKNNNPLSSVIFDYKSILHASKQKGIFLILGYNTAIFNFILKINKKNSIINMDGIEWKREKWSKIIKIWFYINEFFGMLFSRVAIADNPHIKSYLFNKYHTKKIIMIPYGAENKIYDVNQVLKKYGLQKKKYGIIVARPEPENSVYAIIRVFSKKERNIKLVVLGSYNFKYNEFHKRIKNISSKEIIFLGSIYEKKEITSLRLNSLFYFHGHKVGGTNPALVEALATKCPIIAYDNPYNRWVAKNAAIYFNNDTSLDKNIDNLISNKKLRKKLSYNSHRRFLQNFTWDKILKKYEYYLNKNYKI